MTEALGNRIAKHRGELGWTQAELAERLRDLAGRAVAHRGRDLEAGRAHGRAPRGGVQGRAARARHADRLPAGEGRTAARGRGALHGGRAPARCSTRSSTSPTRRTARRSPLPVASSSASSWPQASIAVSGRSCAPACTVCNKSRRTRASPRSDRRELLVDRAGDHGVGVTVGQRERVPEANAVSSGAGSASRPRSSRRRPPHDRPQPRKSRRCRRHKPVPHSPRSKSQNGWSTRAVSQSRIPVSLRPTARSWSSWMSPCTNTRRCEAAAPRRSVHLARSADDRAALAASAMAAALVAGSSARRSHRMSGRRGARRAPGKRGRFERVPSAIARPSSSNSMLASAGCRAAEPGDRRERKRVHVLVVPPALEPGNDRERRRLQRPVYGQLALEPLEVGRPAREEERTRSIQHDVLVPPGQIDLERRVAGAHGRPEPRELRRVEDRPQRISGQR